MFSNHTRIGSTIVQTSRRIQDKRDFFSLVLFLFGLESATSLYIKLTTSLIFVVRTSLFTNINFSGKIEPIKFRFISVGSVSNIVSSFNRLLIPRFIICSINFVCNKQFTSFSQFCFDFFYLKKLIFEPFNFVSLIIRDESLYQFAVNNAYIFPCSINFSGIRQLKGTGFRG